MALRIFISHAAPDTAFAQQLAADLRRAGADVWLDATHLTGPGDFVARISKALNERDVLVLILSPSALASPWVPLEMNAAIVRSNQGYMRPPLVVQHRYVSPRDIPGLWTVYQRIDATASYKGALPQIARALGVNLPQDAPQAPAPTSPVITLPNVPYSPKPAAKSPPQPSAPPVALPHKATPSAAPKVSRRNLLIGGGAIAAMAAGIGVIVKLASANLTANVPDMSPTATDVPTPIPTSTLKAPGTLRWSFQTGDIVESWPTVANSLVYVGSDDGYLYALDASNGKQRWRSQIGSIADSSPAVANGLVYVRVWFDSLYALNAITGKQRWRIPPSGSGDFAVANGLVYVSAQQYLYAYDAATGTQRWSFQNNDWLPYYPSVANDLVYVGSGDGYLYALDASNGKQRWRSQIAGVIPSPAIANGLVYAGSSDSYLNAFYASSGKLHWRFQIGGSAGSLSAPIVANGLVYISSDDSYLYAIDALTGKQRWRSQIGDGIRKSISSAAVANGLVYVGTSDDYLYAVDAGNGKQHWRFLTGGSVSSPAIANGLVYIGSDDHYVYALNA